MKIGICGSYDGLFPIFNDIGADYAEFCLSELHSLSNEEFSNIVNGVKSEGISVEAANGFFPAEIKICGAEYNKDTVSEYCKEALERAATIGIESCVLGSGRSRYINDGENRASCLSQLEETLYIAGEAAKPLGIKIAIEPLNKKECNIFNTAAECYESCKRVNHPNVLLLVDFFHLTKENEPIESIANYSDALQHLHIACPETRKYPVDGDGAYDSYIAFKNVLDKAGYNKRMSLEASFIDDFKSEAKACMAYLKSIFC